MPPVSGRHVARHVSSSSGLAVQLELLSIQSEALRWLDTEIRCLSVLYIYCNWCKLLHVCTLMTIMSFWVRIVRNHSGSLYRPAVHPLLFLHALFSTALSHVFSKRKGVYLQAILIPYLFKQRSKCIRLLLTSYSSISKHVFDPSPPFHHSAEICCLLFDMLFVIQQKWLCIMFGYLEIFWCLRFSFWKKRGVCNNLHRAGSKTYKLWRRHILCCLLFHLISQFSALRLKKCKLKISYHTS